MKYEFNKSYQEFQNEHAYMKVAFVDTKSGDNESRDQCFLYNEIVGPEFGPKQFVEISIIETDPMFRRQGFASKLVKEFIDSNPNVPIFLKAGIISEEQYNKLESQGILKQYILEQIVPFYESLGFINVNETSLHHDSTVIMCYPKDLAQKYMNENKETRIV